MFLLKNTAFLKGAEIGADNFKAAFLLALSVTISHETALLLSVRLLS